MMIKTHTTDNLIFAPYHYNWVEENGTKHEWCLISIKLNGIIMRLTDYHKYVGAKDGVKHAYFINNDAVRRVCNFLTDVLFKNRKYKIDKITEIPFEIVEDYLQQYSKMKKFNGDCPNRQDVEKERSAICHFMKNIGSKRIDYKTHYYARKVLVKESSNSQTSVKRRKNKIVWEYEINATYRSDDRHNNLIRDIPQKAICIIIRAIRREAPDLLFAVLLQLCAGLREGEVVNVRRADSKYPGGIKYIKENGRFISFEVDLQKEYLLRSDGKTTGNIKRKRTQMVYNSFLDVIQDAYEEHMNLVSADDIEPEGPMFVNEKMSAATGKKMAISKQNYCKRIKKILFTSVIPELLKSNDSELKIFGMLLNENSWGLHALRHWFTVQLVLNGEDLNGIAYWRGDLSLESAYTYMQNKGELMKKYQKANDMVANIIIDRISKEDFYGL